MLKPDDTIQFFTSPYRRTRETTEGILRTLTSDDPEQGPSPFLRHNIKVYEEPRLREQDFGNFQPCSAEMERMWQERADYGHFFYRIPDGESAADAYDRVSGFNESLWRQFGDADFPSVCVLVTHGLMTRIFLMKWYHWSVEYFEDLRNVNHCETLVMKQNMDNGKFVLQNELRTWSDLRRRTTQTDLTQPAKDKSSSHLPSRIWGGCVNGCDHANHNFPRRVRRQNTSDVLSSSKQGHDDHASASHEPNSRTKSVHISKSNNASTISINNRASNTSGIFLAQRSTTETGSKSSRTDGTPSTSSAPNDLPDSGDVECPEIEHDDSNGPEEGEASDADDSGSSPISASPRSHLQMPSRTKGIKQLPLSIMGRDFGGSRSGMGSPYISDDADESDYFDTNIHQMNRRMTQPVATPSGLSQIVEGPARSNSKGKKQSTKQWKVDSGMAAGKRADALGDVDSEGEDVIGEQDEEAVDGGNAVEELKAKDRKTFSEIF
jgi:broad specificity phosphatase PhoE